MVCRENITTPKKSKLKILYRNFYLSKKEVFRKLPVQKKGRMGPGQVPGQKFHSYTYVCTLQMDPGRTRRIRWCCAPTCWCTSSSWSWRGTGSTRTSSRASSTTWPPYTRTTTCTTSCPSSSHSCQSTPHPWCPPSTRKAAWSKSIP